MLFRKASIRCMITVSFCLAMALLTAPLWFGSTSKCPALQPEPSNASVEAIPAWSRKYNADCTLCHSAWPRLNRTGYLFRRLGYRMAWEVPAKSKGKPPSSTTKPSPSTSLPPSVSTGLKEGVDAAAKQAAEKVAEGQKVFTQMQCFTCHANGGNIIAPSKPIKGAKFLEKYPEDGQMAQVIRSGVPGTAMPGYAKEKLSDEQLAALVAYVRSLTAGQE